MPAAAARTSANPDAPPSALAAPVNVADGVGGEGTAALPVPVGKVVELSGVVGSPVPMEVDVDEILLVELAMATTLELAVVEVLLLLLLLGTVLLVKIGVDVVVGT